MTTTEQDALTAEFQRWHADREQVLAEPHGWLSLTGLHWLDSSPRAYQDLPGTWRVTDDGQRVEITAAAGDDVTVDDRQVDGSARVEPVDGKPGVLVGVGERRVEVIRRETWFALRVRDPESPTRRAFTGVPTFPFDARWIVEGRYTPDAAPTRIDVDTVIDGLEFHPTATGRVRFTLDGTDHELIALAYGDELNLHFRDATSGDQTYGGGRSVKVSAPDADGRVTIDFNRAVNLPCVLTTFATCPLPPATNVLPVAVTAGETLPD